jgi:large subunit ribosomal protein L13
MKLRKPEHIVSEAVKGMLPANKLSKSLITKLKVYAGSDHPHASQKPEALNIN